MLTKFEFNPSFSLKPAGMKYKGDVLFKLLTINISC